MADDSMASPGIRRMLDNVNAYQEGTHRLIHDPGPTDGELRAASANLMAAQLRDELTASLSTTRRGRLALRLSGWYARMRAIRA